ncbi:MAG: SRPBCC family protein [Brevundimonas sp.]|uniref:SRPBCC family protein n=1 Tax=Brevundimonas sp. TaxID=1871086 RepID=UPI002726EBF9|nr:SRPBCC family protein [Brevundimonas sp.]MDO9587917.1 SRPBCC family protein [Brevundimonas sp.]
MNSHTTVERTSDQELVATRTVDAPARIVFEAFTKPELMMRWWAPKSFGISFLSCEIDARTGGSYRFVFGHPASEQPMAFFGRYIEVTPPSRLVWTNEEAEDGAVTTATFEEIDGRTRVVVHDLYPSKEALDDALASGSTGAWPEQFEALDDLLTTLGASV